ncbi:DegT/DnrJ/EryC1/StrS family aminotransferase [Salirhabdus euzebyi]
MVIRMNEEKILLSPPHLTGKEKQFMEEALDSNWVAPLGPNVDLFEQELAEYVGMKGAAALSSGTAAIHLALRLLNVQPGDIVFCPSLTFIASANPIIYEGAEPVFIDSEAETWNMSPQALENAFVHYSQKGKLPKAVIVVNLYGQSAQLDQINAICEKYNVPIIEDAAESLGTVYKGKKSGSFGRFGVFSFNGNKIITTSGGGMLVSNDLEALKKARFLAAQAKDPAPYYEHSEIGYNYRLSNILAALGRAQLLQIEERVEKRRQIFKRYVDEIGNQPGIVFMPEGKESISNRWLTTLTIDPKVISVSPFEVIKALEKEKIEARHIWKPLHLQPVFKNNTFFPHKQDKVVSEELFEQGLCLPSGSSLTEDQQDRVIKLIKQVLSR